MPIISGGKVIEGARPRAVRPNAIFEYDFAIDGGGVGTIPLRAISSNPGNAFTAATEIFDSILDVLTPLTGGAGATAALQVEAAGDVVAAAVVTGVPWSTAGRKAGIPVSAATSIKTTASRTPSLVVAVNPLTAGKFRLVLEYIDPTV